MPHKYSHGNVLADLWRRGLIQAAPDVNYDSDTYWQRKALFQEQSPKEQDLPTKDPRQRRYSLPSSHTASFDAQEGLRQSPPNLDSTEYTLPHDRSKSDPVHEAHVGRTIEPAQIFHDESMFLEKRLSGTPQSSSSVQTVFQSGIEPMPAYLTASSRTSSISRSAGVEPADHEFEIYDGLSDTEYPETLPPEASAKQRARHALCVLLTQAQESSTRLSLSSSSNESGSRSDSSRSRRSAASSIENIRPSPSREPVLPHSVQPRTNSHAYQYGGIIPQNQPQQAKTRDTPLASIMQVPSAASEKSRVVSVGTARNKVTRFVVPENVKFDQATRPSTLRNQYHPHQHVRMRSRSPSEASISRIVRQTRPTRSRNQSHNTGRLDGVEFVEGVKLASQDPEGNYIPEVEAEEIIALPTLPESQERMGFNTSSNDSETPFGYPSLRPAIAEPRTKIKSAVSHAIPTTQRVPKSRDGLNQNLIPKPTVSAPGTLPESAVLISSIYEHKPLPTPPSPCGSQKAHPIPTEPEDKSTAEHSAGLVEPRSLAYSHKALNLSPRPNRDMNHATTTTTTYTDPIKSPQISPKTISIPSPTSTSPIKLHAPLLPHKHGSSSNSTALRNVVKKLIPGSSTSTDTSTSTGTGTGTGNSAKNADGTVNGNVAGVGSQRGSISSSSSSSSSTSSSRVSRGEVDGRDVEKGAIYIHRSFEVENAIIA